MNKTISKIYLLVYFIVLSIEVYPLYQFCIQEDVSYYSQYIIFFIVSLKLVDIVKNTPFIRSIEQSILTNRQDKSLDILIVYYMSQQKQSIYFICVYINCILAYLRSYLLIENRLAIVPNSESLLYRATKRQLFAMVGDLVMVEIIVGYFNHPVQFENLPNLLILMIIMGYSYEQQFSMGKESYQMYIKMGVHIVLLFYFFPQSNFSFSQILVGCYVLMRIIINEVFKGKRIEVTLGNGQEQQTLFEFLQEFSNQLQQLNEKSETSNLSITTPQIDIFNQNLNQRQIIELQVKILSQLALAQSLFKHIYLKQANIEYQLSIFKAEYGGAKNDSQFLGLVTKETFMQYLITSEYLILVQNECWTGQEKLLENDCNIVCQNRTINYPFGQPLVKNKKKYNANVYLLMILVFKKNLKEHMTFSSDQILYDFYNL